MPNTNGVSPDDILNSYRPMISFLAAAFGPNCEVVLHDIREQDKSVIAIENGSISNRIIGSPMTDLALGALHKIDKGLPYLCNYRGKTKDGRILRSSTFFIHDYEGNAIGMLCLNIDISAYIEAGKALDQLVNGTAIPQMAEETPEYVETYSASLEELMVTILEGTIEKYPIEPGRMTQEEKMELVKELNEKGFFHLKKGVAEAAKRLKISEPTLYRYLKLVEAK